MPVVNSSTAPVSLSLAEARLFHRRAVRLAGNAVPDTGTALAHHGFIQIDPINVCGRMQDLILRNRVENYVENGLMRHLHGLADAPLAAENRTAFEHHLPHSNVLAALPLEAWPWLLAAMRNRSEGSGAWSGGLEPRQEAMAEIILREITLRGPLTSEDLADGQKDHHGWGSHATLAKTTLQKLFFHGRLLIAKRQSNRRFYDLPERILPSTSLSLPEPGPGETARWITLLKLRQRRLMILSPAERARAGDGLIQPLSIATAGGPLLCWCLKSDLPLLEDCRTRPLTEEESRPLLLAPLDPLIYDRRLTSRLWDFDYTWEVYTPPEKRLRGYYALPLLSGLEIAGHIDPKADRPTGKLTVVSRSVRRGHSAAQAVKALAKFLGLR